MITNPRFKDLVVHLGFGAAVYALVLGVEVDYRSVALPHPGGRLALPRVLEPVDLLEVEGVDPVV